MPRYRIRMGRPCPRPCWFAEWLDQHDTIPGVNYREGMAALFTTRAAAELVAGQIDPVWMPVVEEEG